MHTFSHCAITIFNIIQHFVLVLSFPFFVVFANIVGLFNIEHLCLLLKAKVAMPKMKQTFTYERAYAQVYKHSLMVMVNCD